MKRRKRGKEEGVRRKKPLKWKKKRKRRLVKVKGERRYQRKRGEKRETDDERVKEERCSVDVHMK